MGQKVRPTGIRIGITRNWASRWYADKKEFGRYLLEDRNIRRHVKNEFYSAGISRIDIERDQNKVTVNLFAARPGVVIGRKGARIEQLKSDLELIVGQHKATHEKPQIQLNIQEVPVPELDAQLVAESVSDQLKKRAAFRRVLKMTIKNSRDRGALGIKIMISGRLGGAEMARKEHLSEGKIPLSTLRADIDYGFTEAITTYGVIGIKVWIYKGEIIEKEEKPNGSDAKAS